MKRTGVKVLKENKQQIEGKFVLKEEKVYMSKNKELRVKIIQLHYDVVVARHKRRQKMIELVTINYQQLEVTKNFGKYGQI